MKLLMHVCCAPDATVALERLPNLECLQLFFDNPNIQPAEEYARRMVAFFKLACKVQVGYAVGSYDPAEWIEHTKGYETEVEGGERCRICITYRIRRSALRARENGFDTLGCTFTTSPHKRSALIHEIGEKIAGEHGLAYLASDFKKKDGFKRSVDLSKQMGLYRQNYCGCIYSLREPRKLEIFG